MESLLGKERGSSTAVCELKNRISSRILALKAEMSRQAKAWEDFHLSMLAENLHAKIEGLEAAFKIMEEEAEIIIERHIRPHGTSLQLFSEYQKISRMAADIDKIVGTWDDAPDDPLLPWWSKHRRGDSE